jgi:cytoskeletal protein CcmA (bactofilin family)
VGKTGAPEIKGVAPAEYVAVTGTVEGVAMPEVILASGGIVVPTGVVGTGEFEVDVRDEVKLVVGTPDDEEFEATTAPAFCLFPRRT